MATFNLETLTTANIDAVLEEIRGNRVLSTLFYSALQGKAMGYDMTAHNSLRHWFAIEMKPHSGTYTPETFAQFEIAERLGLVKRMTIYKNSDMRFQITGELVKLEKLIASMVQFVS